MMQICLQDTLEWTYLPARGATGSW